MSISEKIPYERIGEIPEYQRWCAIACIHLVVFIGYFFIIYKEKTANVANLVNNINNIEKDLNKNRLRQKKLPKIKEQVSKLNFKLLVARTQLPESKEIPDLLEQISNLGRSSGLEFLLFKPQKEIDKDFYIEVPVHMKVEGTFHDVLSFFDKLANFARIVNIGNIAMGSPAKSGNKTIIKVSSYATTFMFVGREGDEKDKEKSYLNNKLGFSFQYNSDLMMEDKSYKDNLILFTSHKEKDGFKARFSVLLLSGESDIPALMTSYKKNSRIFKNDFKIISEDSPKLGNFTTKRILYTYTKDGKNLKETTGFIYSKEVKKAFQITQTSLAKSYPVYEELFNEGYNSFWIHSKEDFKTIGEEKFWSFPESEYHSEGKRDPFHSLLTTEEMILIVEEDDDKVKTPLEMYDTLSLKLVGIISPVRGKRIAMFETPEGKGFVARKNTPIGKRKGVVTDITNNSVIVEERQKYKIGSQIKIKKETIVLKLRTKKK